ncbi:SRPBCC family protein [Streptomyces orinoci]|uniref:SRPBCC family protein n=1 Tax=Streptomyces orinoci TaxID=67339 RepID=A0ABV3JW69_STRON|nr:SRPBCC family protein [Streptomyces orinoci]
MALHHYRFRDDWPLDAPPDTVYRLLEDAERYPSWWPQIRGVTVGADGVSGGVRLRSLLPYGLDLTARESRRDPRARVLEITVHGDLEGWVRWTVLPRGAAGSTARFEQEVEVRKPLMRWLAVPGRPVFIANHAWMMRRGRRGLRALLERRPEGI